MITILQGIGYILTGASVCAMVVVCTICAIMWLENMLDDTGSGMIHIADKARAWIPVAVCSMVSMCYLVGWAVWS